MGSEVTKTTMMPQLVDLAGDADGDVRIAAVETAVKLMNFLDAESLRDTVVPMVVEAGDRARFVFMETQSDISQASLSPGLVPGHLRESSDKIEIALSPVR